MGNPQFRFQEESTVPHLLKLATFYRCWGWAEHHMHLAVDAVIQIFFKEIENTNALMFLKLKLKIRLQGGFSLFWAH